MQRVERSNVVLEGGGQFEEGQAYIIKDRHGNSTTMVWKNGEFVQYDPLIHGKEMSASSSRKRKTEKGNADGGFVDSDPGEFEHIFDFTKLSGLSDISFRVGGKLLYCSKAILGMYSPVFRAMFSSEFQESSLHEIPLPDKKYSHVLEFMKCLFPSMSKNITQQNVNVVLPLAHEYQVECLISKCREFLQNLISEGWLKTSYLLALFKLIEHYSMETVENLLLDKLCDLDPNDVLAVAADKPELNSMMPTLQKKMMERYFTCYKRSQLELVRTNILLDNVPNYKIENIPGFTTARGSRASITVDESAILRATASAGCKILYRNVMNIWDLSFIVTCHFLTKKQGEQTIPCLSFTLRAVCLPEKNDNWACRVRVKFIRKHPLVVLYGTCKMLDTKCTLSKDKPSVVLFKSAATEVLKPLSGFINDGKLEADVFLLANEPVIVAG